MEKAPSNDWVLRREAVATSLTKMIDGGPGFLISPKCAITRKGMAGGYAYKRVQMAGDERYRDKPDKNRFSHPCEALQYLMLGAGAGETVIPRKRNRAEETRKMRAWQAETDAAYSMRMPARR